MESFQNGPDIDSMLDHIEGEVKMESMSSDNAHDITDDAIETMLMEVDSQTDVTTQQNLVPNASIIQPTGMGGAAVSTQPIQVFTQQKVGNPIITKYVLKRPASASLSPSTHFTTVSNQAKLPALQTVTVKGGNITLSPVKGGFKIPISPMKTSLKVSMIHPSHPTVHNTVSITNSQSTANNPKFQFQTFISSAPTSNRIAVSNIQSNQQQTFVPVPQRIQIPGVKMPCVRLVPANGQNQTGGITNYVTAHANELPPGTTLVQQQQQQQQPFVNIQPYQRTMQQQNKPHQRLIMPATASVATNQQQSVANMSQGALLQAGNIGYAMVPAKYVEQLKKQLNTGSIVYSSESAATGSTDINQSIQSNPTQKVVMNGKLRKPCNCTKSMCLKLYCECFANGHFCDSCNCINCHNNLEFDTDRSKAIKSCLERNPMAFRPKIGRGRDANRTHQKGCNCKRSGCLKNYCECYEARIPCTSKCKCIGCKNLEEDSVALKEQHPLMNLADAAAVRCQQQAASKSRISTHIGEIRPTQRPQTYHSASGERLPYTFFTQEVIEATCTCLLAQAEEAEKTNRSTNQTEMMVLEEFGKCLMQIIQAAGKAKSNPTT
ncbi:protein lin-54 homolog [Ciona intestinalis]